MLFDLDGTLVDTIGLIVASHRHAVTTVLGRDLPDDVLRSGIGRPLIEQMRVFDPDRADELFDAYRTWNHANTERLLAKYPGVDELLLALDAAGVQIGVVTSKARDAVDLAFRILPPPVPLPRARHRTRTPRATSPGPSRCSTPSSCWAPKLADAVYVGDARYDVEAARAAGTAAVAVAWGAGDRASLEAAAPGRDRRDAGRARRDPRGRDVSVDVVVRVDDLRREIERHDHAYYVLDAPTIDDAGYDALLRELRELEAAAPGARDARVADAARARRRADGVRAGAPPPADAVARQRPQRGRAAGVGRVACGACWPRPTTTTRRRYVTEPKIDGLAISLTYEDGVLRPRRDARRRRGRRGRHRQPAHHPRAADAPARRRPAAATSRCAARCTCRSRRSRA